MITWIKLDDRNQQNILDNTFMRKVGIEKIQNSLINSQNISLT